jgi:hypothetical protein
MEAITGMVHATWREIILSAQHAFGHPGIRSDKEISGYKRLSVNVSQAFGSPLSKPRRSQVARCADEP